MRKRDRLKNGLYVSRAAQIEDVVDDFKQKKTTLKDLVQTIQIAAGCAERDRFLRLFPEHADAIVCRSLADVLEDKNDESK